MQEVVWLLLCSRVPECISSCFLVNRENHIMCIRQDGRKLARRDVQQEGNGIGCPPGVPGVGDGCGKFDVTHPFTTCLLGCNLDSTRFAGKPGCACSCILATGAMPILRRTKDSFTEETTRL